MSALVRSNLRPYIGHTFGIKRPTPLMWFCEYGNMARRVLDKFLDSRDARRRLSPRAKPYFRTIERGLHLVPAPCQGCRRPLDRASLPR